MNETLPRHEHGKLAGKLVSYAWPGGYPVFYLDHYDSVLCPECAQAQEEEYRLEILANVCLWCEDGRRNTKSVMWVPNERCRPQSYGVHWEGEPLCCEGTSDCCMGEIESAYGIPD